MSEFLMHWNAPAFILGGITVFLLLAWPMGSAPVAPKRRQKRIDTYFRSTLERSNPRARRGRVEGTHIAGREINPARSHPQVLQFRRTR